MIGKKVKGNKVTDKKSQEKNCKSGSGEQTKKKTHREKSPLDKKMIETKAHWTKNPLEQKPIRRKTYWGESLLDNNPLG